MFEAVGLPVSRLIRVKYGNLELPSDLPRGKTRRMSTEETEKWLDSISYKKGNVHGTGPSCARENAASCGFPRPGLCSQSGQKVWSARHFFGDPV